MESTVEWAIDESVRTHSTVTVEVDSIGGAYLDLLGEIGYDIDYEDVSRPDGQQEALRVWSREGDEWSLLLVAATGA